MRNMLRTLPSGSPSRTTLRFSPSAAMLSVFVGRRALPAPSSGGPLWATHSLASQRPLRGIPSLAAVTQGDSIAGAAALNGIRRSPQ